MQGAMIGVELAVEGTPVVQGCLQKGLLDQLHAPDSPPPAARADHRRRADRRGLRRPGRVLLNLEVVIDRRSQDRNSDIDPWASLAIRVPVPSVAR